MCHNPFLDHIAPFIPLPLNCLELGQAQISDKKPSKNVEDCPAARREHATSLCKESHGAVDVVLLNTCIFDVCFGGDQYAVENGFAMLEAEKEEDVV